MASEQSQKIVSDSVQPQVVTDPVQPQAISDPVQPQVVSDSVQPQVVSIRSKGMDMIEPYYIKVHDGVTTIVAKVGDRIVIIQAKIEDIYGKVKVRVADSFEQALTMVEPYLAKVRTLNSHIASRAQHFQVTIVEGIVRVRGEVGQRAMDFQAKVSDVIGELYSKVSSGIQGAKQAIQDLTNKLMAMSSSAYGEVLNKARMLSARVKDNYVYVTCMINDRVVVFKLKVSEVLDYLQMRSLHMYNTTLLTVTDTYTGVKTSVFRTTEASRIKIAEYAAITKDKAITVGKQGRDLAANREAQVTAVSAAGGAVALGAGGGAAGFVAGGAAGAICAVPAAFFTFGLSIPVGASIGAGAGLCVGTAVGGTAGAGLGGAAGYKTHKHKEEIGDGFTGALSKFKGYGSLAKARAMRVIGHTGGTAFA